MASQNPATTVSTAGRKVRRLTIAIVIVIAAYTAGWFYAAGRIDDFLGRALAHSANGPAKAECAGLAVGGYPFLIGVTCDKTTIRASGLTARFGAFKSAARIYMPGTAVFEIDGPGTLATNSGMKWSGNWDSLRASGAANLSGVTRASLEGREIRTKITLASTLQAFTLSIGHPELHIRANGDDLDVAILVEKLNFGLDGYAKILPEISASADFTLVGKAHFLTGRPYGDKKAKGELRAFKIDLGHGIYGELSGPFSIDHDGWISGKIAMRLEKLDLWQQTLSKAFPLATQTISGMAQMLRGLIKGKSIVTVNLSIDHGTIYLSLLPIGHIPQI